MNDKKKLSLAIINEFLGFGTGREFKGGTDTCICSCGFKINHMRGTPCNSVECPSCGEKMTGKGAPGDKSK